MVLKRKAGTFNISNQRSTLGFSLNNPRRGTHSCSDLFNIPHVSVKNNQGLISTKKWLKRGYPYTVVKNCTPPSNDLYLKKIKGDLAKVNATVTVTNSINGSCEKGYQKNILSMNYEMYYNSNILVKNCIPLPPNKAHYPPQNIKSNNLCYNSLSLEQFNENENKKC